MYISTNLRGPLSSATSSCHLSHIFPPNSPPCILLSHIHSPMSNATTSTTMYHAYHRSSYTKSSWFEWLSVLRNHRPKIVVLCVLWCGWCAKWAQWLILDYWSGQNVPTSSWVTCTTTHMTFYDDCTMAVNKFVIKSISLWRFVADNHMFNDKNLTYVIKNVITSVIYI